MATNFVRFASGDAVRWGVVAGNRIAALNGDYPTTAALIERGEADWREAAKKSPGLSLNSVEILPPATTPCRLFCQGANYRQHLGARVRKSTRTPRRFNMFFTKSDASITSSSAVVHRPSHVKLLDYEVELALVFRSNMASPLTVTQGNRSLTSCSR